MPSGAAGRGHEETPGGGLDVVRDPSRQDAPPAARACTGRRGRAARRPLRRPRQGDGRRGGFAVAGHPRHTARRLGQRARQPQPVHRLLDLVVPRLSPQLRPAHRVHGGRRHPGARPGRELDHQRRRARVDVQAAARRQVAGRRAVHRRRRRLHLRLHHQEPAGRLHQLHDRHHQGGSRRRPHGQVHDGQAQGEHARDGRTDRARAHLEQDQPARPQGPPSRTSRRSSAPGRSRSSTSRRATSCAWPPTSSTGAARPRSTR